MNRKTIAFIGGGNMGEAIISKMVSSDWKGDDIHVIDHNEEKLERLSSEYGVHAHKEPGSWLSEIDAVVLAVKPQQLAEAIHRVLFVVFRMVGQSLCQRDVAKGLRKCQQKGVFTGFSTGQNVFHNVPFAIQTLPAGRTGRRIVSDMTFC